MPKKSVVLRFKTLFILIACISVFSVGCNRSGKHTISQKKMVDILVDIHIADAMSSEVLVSGYNYILDTTTLYNSVFEKHHITKAMFDSSMAYYSKHPEYLKNIYDKVTGKLGAMESNLAASDTLNRLIKPEIIWQDTRVHLLPQMGKTSKIEIIVPVKKTGDYMVSANIKLFKDDESEKPRMTIYFWYDDGSPQGYREYFPDVPLRKDEKIGNYTISKRLTNPKVTNLRGYILNDSNTDSLFKKHALVTFIKVTRMQ